MRFAKFAPTSTSGDGRCVGDFLPRETDLSLAEAATKYREMTPDKYKSNECERGAVALRLEVIAGV